MLTLTHEPSRGATTRRGSKRNDRRRGITSVLAMLYLMIFSALALGFYAQTNMSSQISSSERRTATAQVAAESGVAFLRYHLSALDVPYSLTLDKQFEEIYMQLADRLDGSGNLGGGVVGYSANRIDIPEKGYVNLDAAGKQRFAIRIERAGDVLVSKFTGRVDGVTVARAIEVRFTKATNASAIFNYGIAGRGRVVTSGSARIIGATDPTKGSILSTSSSANPVDISGTEVSGDISVSNPTASVTYKSGTMIGGSSVTSVINSLHIHKGIAPPEFPEIDTAVYKQYAKTPYVAGMTTLDNVFIPAGTNPSLSNVTIRGVLYIYAPNQVKMTGGVTIQGVIVSPTGTATNTSANTITMTGNSIALPIETLPDTTAFAEVRKLGGGFIIAPGFAIDLGGNMGTIGGSIIASKFSMTGSASGTINGSVIVTDDLPTAVGGSADVIIAATGTTKYPPGVTFGAHYAAIPGSYLEVLP